MVKLGVRRGVACGRPAVQPLTGGFDQNIRASLKSSSTVVAMRAVQM